MHDYAKCPICHGLPVEGAMSDDEFYTIVLPGSKSMQF